jgi:hypothetical protein
MEQSTQGASRPPLPRCWHWPKFWLRSGLLTGLLLWGSLGSALAQRPTSNVIIIRRRPPVVVWPYPYPIPTPETETVRVEFDAQGTDWGAVYLDGRLIYRPHNFDRRKTIHLSPGGYRLEITGVVRSEVWASGYLDIGRDSSQIVVVRFSKAGGVSVSGSPYVWIPD